MRFGKSMNTVAVARGLNSEGKPCLGIRVGSEGSPASYSLCLSPVAARALANSILIALSELEQETESEG